MVILVANTGQYNPPDSLHPFGLLDVTGLSWKISPPFQSWFLRMPGINELAVWLPLGQLHMLHLRLRKSTVTLTQLQQPQPQPPRHSAPSRSSRMVRAQREIAQAFGQFADARGVKLRVGVAMPKPGAGWLCHEKGKEKR